ncbi:MAG: aspartate aminotransferase family protein [Gammaproteobacteria bacterium]
MNTPARSNLDLVTALQDAERRYTENNPLSKQRFPQACEHLPGGNTRSLMYFSPFPLTIKRGEGAKLWDIDGHCYSDFLGEYSAGLYGHSHPKIVTAIQQALADGFLFGGPNLYETRLAELICERFPSCEMVRFCNSGTEANLLALTAARAITGRSHTLVFQGAYHGSLLYFGHGGETMQAPYPTVSAVYNDLPGTLAVIEQHAKDLAAILLEPMMGAAGCIQADKEFLQALRDTATKHGIILIFDEVMTSRLGPGGLQERLGIIPDMSTFGKYLGGGLTFGALGGREHLMARFDARRPDALTHSGTYNNNIPTMAAGVAGLTDVFTAEVARSFNAAADAFRERLNGIARQHQVRAQFTGVGSLLAMHFTDQPIRCPQDVDNGSAPELRTLFHLFMLEQGFYMARRGYMTLSLPLEASDYDGFAKAFEEFVSLHGHLW